VLQYTTTNSIFSKKNEYHVLRPSHMVMY